MDRKVLPAIAIPAAAIVFGVVVFGVIGIPEPAPTDTGARHNMVWSGPIGVTQYKHRLGDNVFFHVRGLAPDERGTIGIFTPEGILYRSFEYDGSLKPDFNHYFFPDTYAPEGICTPEQLVGIWRVVWADDSYRPLEFEMTSEYIGGGEKIVNTVC